MLPDQPNSPESAPLPARHRPTLGNLAQDTTELDLWAFDDDHEPDSTEKSESTRQPALPKSRNYPSGSSGEIPTLPATMPVPAFERIRRNITKAKPSGITPPSSRSASLEEEDFEDLERWEDAPSIPTPHSESPVSHQIPTNRNQPTQREPQVPAQTAIVTDSPQSLPAPPEPNTVLPSDPSAQAIPPETPTPASSPPTTTTTSPPSNAPSLGKLEWSLLAVFTILLLSVLGWLLSVSVFSLPKESQRLGNADFPVKGAILQVQSATTFWRSPHSNVEVVRRGTQLIPVVRLQFANGTGQVRVVFTDAEGKTVGDAFTRSVKDREIHEFGATAGFDDIGMYANYRTGGSKPWTVRVFEAPTGMTQSQDFKKLLELDIAPERLEPTPQPPQ